MDAASLLRATPLLVVALLWFAEAAASQATAPHVGVGVYPCSISRIALSPDEKLVVSVGVGYDPKLRAWALETGRKNWESEAVPRAVLDAVAFDPTGSIVVSGSWNGGLDIWDTTNGKRLQSITVGSRTDTGIEAVAFSKDGRYFGVSTQTGRTLLYSTQGWEEVAELPNSGMVESLAFSPDGQLIATADFGTVKLWNAKTGGLLRSLPARSGSAPRLFMDNQERLAQLWRMVWQVDFSHDGTWLASGTDGYIQVWNLKTGLERSFVKSGGRPGSIAFSSDDVSVAWGNWNNEIRVWRVNSKSQVVLKTVSAFGNVIFSSDFSRAFVPDGKMTINVIQIPTGRVTNSMRCSE